MLFLALVKATALLAIAYADVDAIIYENVGYSGSYMDVTNMDESSCKCSQESKSFSGNLSPLDEGLSVHFRGPLRLLQFGVYYPGGASNTVAKRELQRDGHVHKREDASTVAVTSTFISNPASSTVSAGTRDSTSSSWTEYAYYTPGSTSNCVFMNYKGGTPGASGTWSSCFGNSLTFAASNGVDGASSAQALNDVTLVSGEEYIIFSGAQCDENSCGYVRTDVPGYQGFAGSSKMFIFEFEMPTASSSSSSVDFDMPAVWLLNSKIPRTLQYGDSSCSCWSTGCGELDLFEVLSSGGTDTITHVHDGKQDIGCSSTFSRPTGGSSFKAAVIFDGASDKIHIVKVDDDSEFGSGSIGSGTVSSWMSKSGSTVSL